MRARARAALRAGIVPLVASVLVTCGGCGRDERAPAVPKGDHVADLPTEDVPPPPDARVDITRDRQEHRRAESFSGVLPGGFPRGLPLPPQASLVDQGPRWVEVLVPQHAAAVQQPYLSQLRGAGWSVSPAGERAWSLARGGVAVRLDLRVQGPSTRLRLAY